jgi:RNA polymerase sigma-70 factor (ECF subfamily)
VEDAAFTSMYVLYADALVRYIARIVRDRHAAHDIAHDVLLKAFELDPPVGEAYPPIRAWLFRVAHNAALDHAQRERRSSPEDPASLCRRREAEPAPAGWGSTEGVHDALSGLTPALREVMDLRYRDGLTTSEIGAALDKTAVAVRQLQFRALRDVRAHLDATS